MVKNKLSIFHKSVKFPKSYNISSGHLYFSWGDLLWATITVGRPSFISAFQHGNWSIYEAVSRVSTIKMALGKSSYDQHLYKTSTFKDLDATEKGFVSYSIGMVFCKLFASKLLETPWLLHLDAFKNQLAVGMLAGRSKPDFIGQDIKGLWHAFEAKGRSSGIGNDNGQKAKSQALRITSVNGSNCTLHIGSIAHFHKDQLRFFWRDPEPNEQMRIQIEVKPEHWQHYYQFALALVSDSASTQPLPLAHDIDVTVEIHDKVLALLQEEQWFAAKSLATNMQQELFETGFQADGIRVNPGDSWNEWVKGELY